MNNILTDPEYPGVIVRFETYAPEHAQKILDERNPRNRREKLRKTAGITRDIGAGEFVFNGATIVFYDDGDLADGQHRLKGIAAGGRPERVLVVEGVRRKALPTIDSGTARSVADALTFDGVPSANKVQAVARRIRTWMDDASAQPGKGSYAPSNPEVMAAIAEFPQIPDLVRAAQNTMSRADGCHLRVTNVAFVRWLLLAESRQDAVDWFFARVADGAGVGKGHPVLALRVKLLRQHDRRYRLTDPEQMGFMLQAWNLTMSGQFSDRMQVPDVSKGQLPFSKRLPEPVVVSDEGWMGLITTGVAGPAADGG
jgi:hypothetical protein